MTKKFSDFTLKTIGGSQFLVGYQDGENVRINVSDLVTVSGAQTISGHKEFTDDIALKGDTAGLRGIGFVDDADVLHARVHYNHTNEQLILNSLEEDGTTKCRLTFGNRAVSMQGPEGADAIILNPQDLTDKAYVDELDEENVKTTEDQVIEGEKDFTGGHVILDGDCVLGGHMSMRRHADAGSTSYLHTFDKGAPSYNSRWVIRSQNDAGDVSATTLTHGGLELPSNPTLAEHATRKSYVDGLTANTVKTTGNQTIAGTKTFSSPAIINGRTIASPSTESLTIGADNPTDIGRDSTLVGNGAGGDSVQTGQTSFGRNAGRNNAGSLQTAIGQDAGLANQSTDQTAVGHHSGRSNTGENQVCIGGGSGSGNSGNNQTTVGVNAGGGNSGIQQTAIGFASGVNNTQANQTVVGVGCGGDNTGLSQTAVGTGSGRFCKSDDCVSIGAYTNHSPATSRANTVVIGTGTDEAPLNPTKANQVILGNSAIAETVLRGNVLGENAPTAVDHLTRKDYVDATVYNAKFATASPGTVAAGPESTLLVFDEVIPAGVLEVSYSLVVDYTTANDKFAWRVSGPFASPTYIKESKDGQETIPLTFTFPVQWAGGQVALTMHGEALNQSVDIPHVNIIVKRIG